MDRRLDNVTIELKDIAVTGEFMPGTVIGQYVIVRKIGAGGMGAVYEVEHRMLHQTFALKVLHLQGDSEAERQENAQRFLQEARVTARLSHRGIVGVQTLEVDSVTGTLYFVMEYVAMTKARRMSLLESALEDGRAWSVSGGNSSVLKRQCVSLALEDLIQYAKQHKRRICPALVRRILMDVCEALHYAHTSGGGVIHRDIKPANILVRPDGRAVIADFGVAKIADQQLRQQVLRRQGQSLSLRMDADGSSYHIVLGTLEYMAPELRAGEPPSAQTDLYALGVTAYQLLTGEFPPASGTLSSVYGAAEAWDRCLMRCLDALPEHRYESVEAFRYALERLPRASILRKLRKGLLVAGLLGIIGGLICAVCFVEPKADGGIFIPPPPDASLYLTFEEEAQGLILRRVHPDTCGALNVQSHYFGKPVIKVYDSAFEQCSHLTSHTLPPGVIRVFDTAAYHAVTPEAVNKTSQAPMHVEQAALTSSSDVSANVGLTSGVAQSEAGENAVASERGWNAEVLDDGTLKLVSYSGAWTQEQIVIPERIGGKVVTELGAGLLDASKASAVTIPPTVRVIHSAAFIRMSNLKRITFPAGTLHSGSGKYGLQWCTALEEVVIEDEPDQLMGALFSHCNSLKRVIIHGENLPGFTPYTFEDVHPDGVEIILTKSNKKYWAKDGDVRILNDGKSDIPAELAKQWSYEILDDGTIKLTRYHSDWAVKKLVIPEVIGTRVVSEIGSMIIDGETETCDVRELIIPATIRRYHPRAFRSMGMLEKVTICGNSLNAYQGAWIFSWCVRLREVIIEGAPKAFPSYLFDHCHSLRRIEINGRTLPQYSSNVFNATPPEGVEIVLTKRNQRYCVAGTKTRLLAPDEILPASKDDFSSFALSKCELPAGTGYALNHAYDAHRTDITFPNYIYGRPLMSLKSWCLEYFSDVRTLHLPEQLYSVDESALARMSALERVMIPATVEHWGNASGVFAGCSALKEVLFLASMPNLGPRFFKGCKALQRIIVTESTPPRFTNDTFANTSADGVEIVCLQSKSRWRNGKQVGTLKSLEELNIPGSNVVFKGHFVVRDEPDGTQTLLYVNFRPTNKKVKLPTSICRVAPGAFRTMPEGVTLILSTSVNFAEKAFPKVTPKQILLPDGANVSFNVKTFPNGELPVFVRTGRRGRATIELLKSFAGVTYLLAKEGCWVYDVKVSRTTLEIPAQAHGVRVLGVLPGAFARQSQLQELRFATREPLEMHIGALVGCSQLEQIACASDGFGEEEQQRMRKEVDNPELFFETF